VTQSFEEKESQNRKMRLAMSLPFRLWFVVSFESRVIIFWCLTYFIDICSFFKLSCHRKAGRRMFQECFMALDVAAKARTYQPKF
jgi:hypothetical protein